MPQNPGGSSGGWHQFGNPASGANVPSRGGMGSAPAPSANRGSMGSAPSSPGNSAGWRRFGEPGGQGAAPSASGRTNAPGAGGWQRFGSPNAGSTAPRSGFSAPNSSGRIQVNPPMVRQRNSPQYNSAPQQQ